MEIIKTVSQLKALKSIRVKKTVVDLLCIEDWENVIKECKKIAKEENISIGISENKIELDGTRTILKPKLKKESIGNIIFRSNDYIFTDEKDNSNSYGDTITKSMLLENGFFLPFPNGGKIKYEIV